MIVAMQFTHWLNKESDCHGWFRWFEERGVPAAIVQAYPRTDHFCVMRQGKVELHAMPSKYKILHECNGFVG